LIYPEFSEFFGSAPHAVRLIGAKTLLPSLGLLTVAALLPPDWDLRLVDMNTREVSEDDWNWAEMVMLSGMLVQRESLIFAVREAKKRGRITVAGGPYPSSQPDKVLRAGCDFVVCGEGENTVPLLLDALRKGETTRVVTSDEYPDLSGSPIPRFDLLNLDDYANIGIQTSRGCPFDCEFCDVINLFGRKPRYKEPDRVIEELEAIYRLGWRGEIFVSDDNFIGNKARARAILEKLIPWLKHHGEPFTFWTQTSVNLGQDVEMIDLMTEANFTTVFVGIETPDEDVLTLNRKFQNVRVPLLESLDTIAKNGLSVVASLVIGFDGEERGAGRRISAFIEQSAVPVVQMALLQAMPNTRLWNRLKREGRLLEDRTTGAMVAGRLNFVPSRPVNEILEEYAEAWQSIYDPWTFLERAYRYYLKMRPTRKALAIQRGEPVPDDLIPRGRSPLRQRFHSHVGALKLLWWQGVRAPYRLLFWKQLIGMWQKNPSRLHMYMKTCALGWSMVRMVPLVCGKVAAHRDSNSTDRVP